MTVTLGFDVEEFDFPLERGRGIDFGTQLAVSSEGLEFLLDLLARLELRATFYTTANFALHRTDLVRRIVAGGTSRIDATGLKSEQWDTTVGKYSALKR